MVLDVRDVYCKWFGFTMAITEKDITSEWSFNLMDSLYYRKTKDTPECTEFSRVQCIVFAMEEVKSEVNEPFEVLSIVI